MKIAAAILGSLFTFAALLLFTVFFCNFMVEGLPTRYQLLGYGMCLLVAVAGGANSFRVALRRYSGNS